MTLAALLLCLLAPPAPNLLPGDTSFRLGVGPFQLVDSAEPLLVPRLVDHCVELPTPGARPGGCALVLPCTPPLTPGATYTWVLDLRAESAVPVELSARDPFGQGAAGRVTVGPHWRPVQLTFVAPAPVLDEADAVRRKLDWRRRQVVPGDDAPTSRVTLRLATVAHRGGATAVLAREARLVAGASACTALPAPLDIDANWSDQGPAAPCFAGPSAALQVRATGAPDIRALLTLRDSAGRVACERHLAAATPADWSVSLAEVPPGWYQLDLLAEAGPLTARRTRTLTLLRPRTGGGPFVLDAAAMERWGGHAAARTAA